MKGLRSILVVLCVVSTSVVVAQSRSVDESMRNDAAYRALALNVETEQSRCDSIARVVADMRERYAADEQSRTELAPKIVALEGESAIARRRYDKAVADLALFERQWIAANYNRQSVSPATSAVSADTTAEGIAETPHKSVADLIKNPVFASTLAPQDYKALCDAQAKEPLMSEYVANYLNIHSSLEGLRNGYLATESESVADSLMVCFNDARGRQMAVENSLTDCWSQIYDNKIYCYDLMMEMLSRKDILAEAERASAVAASNAEESRGYYASDALTQYCLQKRWLLEYESRIASALSLTKAKDSLARAAAASDKIDFRIDKIALERRYFVDYEPLKVIVPTIYNARNPIPPTKIYEHGTIYRIRIGVFMNRPNVSALRGITPLSYATQYNDGRYAYFVGGFRTEEEAKGGVAYLKRLGFRDPVIVMWRDGEYITDIAKWRLDHADKYSVEISGTTTLSEDIRQVLLAKNEQCQFSRVGNVFVVSGFNSRAEAEEAMASVVRTDSRLTVKIATGR